MKKDNKDFNILEYYLAELVFGAIFIIAGVLLGFNDILDLKNSFLAIIILVIVFLGIPFLPILFKKIFRK